MPPATHWPPRTGRRPRSKASPTGPRLLAPRLLRARLQSALRRKPPRRRWRDRAKAWIQRSSSSLARVRYWNAVSKSTARPGSDDLTQELDKLRPPGHPEAQNAPEPAREAPNGVDSRSGILQNSERAGRKSVSAPKPNLEGDVLLDPKTKFLSLDLLGDGSDDG